MSRGSSVDKQEHEPADDSLSEGELSGVVGGVVVAGAETGVGDAPALLIQTIGGGGGSLGPT